MSEQHKANKREEASEEIKPSAYLRAMKTHLRSGKQKDAFRVLQEAAVRFPEEPLILSFYGYLQAQVDKKYRTGVETSKKAIALLKGKALVEKEALYPVFYLNLGRTYIAAGKKREAIAAFQQGLQYDNGHYDLLRELRVLGVRKSPPVPFLDRSNLINKYIGLILSKKKVAGAGKDRRRTLSR